MSNVIDLTKRTRRDYKVLVNGVSFTCKDCATEAEAVETACIMYLEEHEEVLYVEVDGGGEHEVGYDWSLFPVEV